jgi:hypothetical protein
MDVARFVPETMRASPIVEKYSLLDETFLSFIRKLRKDLVDPVNHVKGVLDRINRKDRNIFCFSG